LPGVHAIESEYNVDLSRIFLAGHSRGAAMAYIAFVLHAPPSYEDARLILDTAKKKLSIEIGNL
jgi:predicted peptidase